MEENKVKYSLLILVGILFSSVGFMAGGKLVPKEESSTEIEYVSREEFKEIDRDLKVFGGKSKLDLDGKGEVIYVEDERLGYSYEVGEEDKGASAKEVKKKVKEKEEYRNKVRVYKVSGATIVVVVYMILLFEVNRKKVY